jgi:hypothetical protein
MKTCKGCKWAEWKKTANGRLHPSGDGLCAFPVKAPVLPSCISGSYGLRDIRRDMESAHRGISRNRELRDHCPCYAQEAA